MAKQKEKEKGNQVRDLYEKVQSNKERLLNAESGRYLTDGNFRLDQNSAIINLKAEKNLIKLRDAYASLIEKFNSKLEANSVLGLPELGLTHYGATLKEWTSDFTTSVDRVNKSELLRKIQIDEEYLLTLDPSILEEIKLEEIASRASQI